MTKAILILGLFICTLPIFGQRVITKTNEDSAFFTATNKWFAAWKLLSKDIYKIDKVKPVDFIFFDGSYVYSTSTTVIKKGIPIKGPNLINLKLQWKKQLHHDTLTLPDKSVLPVNLMSFAAQNSIDSSKCFFVMPLPDFWKKAGVASEELGLDNLITGVFIHEFSHSQQMQNFGAKMTEFEKQNNFGVDFSDDIVQSIFSKDSSYLKYYEKEIEVLYRSAKANPINKQSLNEGLAKIKERQNDYFKGKFENLKLIDDFFLTMEGLGQYSMYLWLIHPRGGNIKREIVINGVRRGGTWWSQDEGFALFLILDRLTKPEKWVKKMFGIETVSVVDLIYKNSNL